MEVDLQAMVSFEERLLANSFKGPGFDQIRLAAATVVLLHHCRGTQYDIRIDPLFVYSGGYIHFGLLAVLVFFAISGFLVTPGLARSGNVTEYMVHRAVRIFPALFVIVLASMLVVGPALTSFSQVSYFSDPKLYLYAKNVLTLSYNNLPGVVSRDGQPIIVNGALWTLHFEVLSYFALGLMSMMGMLRRRSVFMMVFAASYAIYVALSFEPTIVAAFVSDRFGTFIGLFVYFGAGAALYIFRQYVPFSGLLACAAFTMVVVALPYGFGPVFLPLCLPYITVFCGLSVLPGGALLKRDLSYGVYLIHAPILVAFSLVFPNVRAWEVVAMIVFFITLILAYLCWTFVEGPALRQKKNLSNWVHCRMVELRSTLRISTRHAVADRD